MKNSYTYEVHTNKQAGVSIPLHIVQIRHKYLNAFAVFNTAEDARAYITREKTRLYSFSGLELVYDYKTTLSNKLLKHYINANTGMFSSLQTDHRNKQIFIR